MQTNIDVLGISSVGVKLFTKISKNIMNWKLILPLFVALFTLIDANPADGDNINGKHRLELFRFFYFKLPCHLSINYFR